MIIMLFKMISFGGSSIHISRFSNPKLRRLFTIFRNSFPIVFFCLNCQINHVKKHLLIIFTICLAGAATAQQRSTEICFRQTGDQTVSASVVYYSNFAEIKRDSVLICWGDGFCEQVKRANGLDADNNGIPEGEIIATGFGKHIYTGTHTYHSPGKYLIYTFDPNRNGGIINVNYPNSEQTKFYVEAELQVLENAEGNHSPVLLEAPVDFAWRGFPFRHVVNAFDIDDDSVAYELAVPLMGFEDPVPAYLALTEIAPGPENQLTLDPETGELVWNAPQQTGLYNLAVLVKSYRDGQLIDKVIRDFQIQVLTGENQAPEIVLNTVEYEIQEVAVGDTVIVDASVFDNNPTQLVTFTSSSGLYGFFDQPATFTQQVTGNMGSGRFYWIVRQEHLRRQPYQVVFKAKDDFAATGYSAFKLIRYRVAEGFISGSHPVFAKRRLEVFPNPASDLLQIRLNPEHQGILNYRLITVGGIPLQSGQLLPSQPYLDTSMLPQGIYLLEIRIGNELFTCKISK